MNKMSICRKNDEQDLAVVENKNKMNLLSLKSAIEIQRTTI